MGESYLQPQCVLLFESDNKLFFNTLPLPQYWSRLCGAMGEIWRVLPKQSMAKPGTKARWYLKNHEPKAAGILETILSFWCKSLAWLDWSFYWHGYIGHSIGMDILVILLAWLSWSSPSSTRRQPGLCRSFTAVEKTQSSAYVPRSSCLCIFRSSLAFTKESWLLHSLLRSALL